MMQVGVARCCMLILSIHKEIANFFYFFFLIFLFGQLEREYIKVQACFVLETDVRP